MSSEAVSILLLAGAFLVVVLLLSASANMDLAGPVRSWFWGRDARRMRRKGWYPPELRRAYWSRREYDRDRERLRALGYRTTSEEAVDPFITLPSLPAFGRTTPRPRRRRVPCLYIEYAHEPEAGAERASPVQ